MSRFGILGKSAVGLATVALGALAALKVHDERHVADIWDTLEQSPTRDGVFREDLVAELPEPARRYFMHAIKPGTPLATRLHWRYHGQVKAGASLPWMSLTAEQVLVKERGFVWKARARKGPLVVTARDHFFDGEGRMRIAIGGLIPIVNAMGPDMARSTLGRLLIEGLALPTTFLPGPHAQINDVDADRFTVTIDLYGETTPITLWVDDEGRLLALSLLRWGNLTEDGSFQHIPYGARLSAEQTFGGYTIPTQVAGGWWFGTERYMEDFRLRVDSAHLD